MKIQVNTDHNIEGSDDLNRYITDNLEDKFERFRGAITRIEVHLSDENAGKVGENDKRCLLEARIANRTPLIVSHHADTIHEAIEGASDKLLRSLDSMAGKLTNRTSPKDFLPDSALDNEED